MRELFQLVATETEPFSRVTGQGSKPGRSIPSVAWPGLLRQRRKLSVSLLLAGFWVSTKRQLPLSLLQMIG